MVSSETNTVPDRADLVVRLQGAGIENADAGGKGSALDRLVSVGANVPATSVVTTAAYRLFVSDPSISTLLQELIAGELPPPEDHPAEQERVDQAFLQLDLPPMLIEAMAELGPRIGDGAEIAVRSSATAEDTATASFAGQYRSFLNVGPDATGVGWVYQYFTPKELRDQARKESQAPRNSYELAFRNQFFTPRYVVEFLTDNTLGRIWYDMRKGDTTLKDP